MWHAIGRQLRQPSGWAAALAGPLMRLVNARPNALAVAALDVRPGDTVLELGCGPGHGLRLLAARAGHGVVHGIDHSAAMLRQAGRRNRAAIRAGRIRLHRGGFERLPLPDGSVDRILAVNVAYFWRDPPAVLAEARRVLQPGGVLAIYVTDAATMRRWRFAGSATHRHYDRELLARLLGDAEVRPVRLPFGVGGLLATAGKQGAAGAGG